MNEKNECAAQKKQHAMQMSSTEGSYVHHIGNVIFGRHGQWMQLLSSQLENSVKQREKD